LVPAAAKNRFDEGVRAAHDSNWLTAIKAFQEAQSIAPGNGPILFNLGLAESKIPGRELRSIAWFKAYLSVSPNAENVAAVNTELRTLETRARSQINEWIALGRKLGNQLQGNYQREVTTYQSMALQVGLGEIDSVKEQLEAIWKSHDGSQ